MESTDKLRKLADECYTFNDCSDKLVVTADEIEQEIAELESSYKSAIDEMHDNFMRAEEDLKREIAERYMELPVDADGVPIRVGDIMDSNDGDLPEKVLSVSPEKAWFGGTIGISGKRLKHVKQRTIEDVLEEFLIEFDDWDWNTGGNDRDNARKQLFAKYADELRSMGVGE